MSLRDLLARANRLQQSMPFKIAASIAVVVAALAVFAVYFVSATAPDLAPPAPQATPEAPAGADAGGADGGQRSALDSVSRISARILARRTDPLGVGAGIAGAAGVALVVVWLDLGLTYLGLGLLVGLLVTPMWLLSRTEFAATFYLDEDRRSTLAGFLSATARLLAGLVALTASFTALMSGLRVLLSGAGPVLAVARNVLAEAVRMKVSLVFMVLLVFFLAALPDQLNETTPLRYRVQTFLQYGTTGSFWVIAVLVLAFGVGSVAFEQRDRQIWQTMTKPVAAWQYVLGKWLGVSGLAAVLLAVSVSGVFLFTEYLRQQPAQGEDGVARGGVLTNDRFILETQVLTARNAVRPEPVILRDSEEFRKGLRSYIDTQRVRDPNFATDDKAYNKVADDLYTQLEQVYRAIGPGLERTYRFTGLKRVKDLGRELTLRYRIESGANLPSITYKLTFTFGGYGKVEEVGLGISHNLPLPPDGINDDGIADLVIFNGDAIRGTANPETISFPPGGLELSYSVGGYRVNFLKAALVLWVKLAFLAMLAITCATFLSFPVACLVAFSVFLAAETASFLTESLEYYDAIDEKRNIVYHRVVIRAVSVVVAGMFRVYAELKPTAKLVDGRVITWGAMATGTAVLAAWTAGLYALAVLVFRRRELATYSGQ